MGVTDFGKCLYCRSEASQTCTEWLLCSGGSHCHRPLWGTQEVTLGWAGECQPHWRCQQEDLGTMGGTGRGVGTAGIAECEAPTPSGSFLTITQPWLPPSLSPSTKVSQIQI